MARSAAHRGGAGDLEPEMRGHWDPDRALYGISVAAELTGVNPQMLRAYEAKGLLQPYRTEGGTRRYSGNDLDRVHQITSLLDEGLNLTGIAHVLQLQAETRRLRKELNRLRGRDEAAEASARDSG
jgi:MerR family transcriptional regulator, heat shock protein HspR